MSCWWMWILWLHPNVSMPDVPTNTVNNVRENQHDAPEMGKIGKINVWNLPGVAKFWHMWLHPPFKPQFYPAVKRPFREYVKHLLVSKIVQYIQYHFNMTNNIFSIACNKIAVNISYESWILFPVCNCGDIWKYFSCS